MVLLDCLSVCSTTVDRTDDTTATQQSAHAHDSHVTHRPDESRATPTVHTQYDTLYCRVAGSGGV
jgi:hypothetical protein